MHRALCQYTEALVCSLLSHYIVYTRFRQCLTTPSSGQRVIFCTHFCLLLPSPPSALSPTARSTLHHLPTPPSLTSSHTRGRSGGGLCQIRSPHKSPSSHIPSITRSPSQVCNMQMYDNESLRNPSNLGTDGRGVHISVCTQETALGKQFIREVSSFQGYP